MPMSNFDSQSPSAISYSQNKHFEAAALRYLMKHKVPYLSIRYSLYPVPYLATITRQSATVESKKAVLQYLSDNWAYNIATIPLHEIEWRVSCYTAEQQAELINLLNLTGETMKQQLEDRIPPDIMARLNESLLNIESALIANDPLISNHLRASHNLLISYPETVHLLDDAEIANLIKAAEVHTKIVIAKVTAPKAAKASMKKAGLDDF